MKKAIIILFFLSIVSAELFAQFDDAPPPHKMREKIFQLEKIKLIETLQMDEETTLRFFSRRSETESSIDGLKKNLDEVLDKIDQLISSDKPPKDEELKPLIKEVGSIRLQIDQKRVDFVKSLDDILTPKQIAKFVVFEKRFREELAKSLMKERKHKDKSN